MRFSLPFFFCLLLACATSSCSRLWTEASPIKVGALVSLTGTMAQSEAPLLDVMRMAVEEINASGGLLGRPIQIVAADCRSDAAHCAKEADRLIETEQVQALFGCWTSACRKAVRQVVERHDHLLFYPLQYEGLETSPNIVYTGMAPNQQLIPAVRWALDHLGNRMYLIGSDYVFPRTANMIMKDLILSQEGFVVGERYLPLGNTDMTAVIADIINLNPSVILNTINGDSNRAFFQALGDAGMQSASYPVISFSLSEPEISEMNKKYLVGHYCAWAYFQSLDNSVNQAFVQRFRGKYGQGRVIGDPMESMYTAVLLWKKAVELVESTDARQVNTVITRQSIKGPAGIVAVSRRNRHLWKQSRIGKIRLDGQFEVVWESLQALSPEPFPHYRNKADWERMSLP